MSLNSEKDIPRRLFDPSDKIPSFEIDDIIRKELCFREDLIISLKDDSTSDTKPVGGYSISSESIGREDKEFLIQALSSFSVNDNFAGSKLTSSTTANLHCLEEKRTEFIQHADGLDEKVLFLGLEDDIYHLKIEDLCPCDKSYILKKDLPLCCYGELLSEGANLLLMRYLALKNFHGSLSFQSIMIGGQLTTCNYRCTEAQCMEFNNHTLEVYTVERRMHEECGLVHNTKTHMTRKGYILRHDWLEVPYLLQINPLLHPHDIDNKEPKIQVPLRSRWSSDVQMLSMYLDQKTCKIAQQTEYLADHPEIKQLISDYTQTLLAGNLLAAKADFLPSFLRQPINVLSFTIQHFAAFATNPYPTEIHSSGESNMDIMSQLSRQKPKQICSLCGICSDCIMSKQPLPNSEGDRGGLNSHYPLPGSESPQFSLCSVFSKCPSDSTCVKKVHGESNDTVTCSEYCKACNIEDKTYSQCNFHPECKKFCQGCQSHKDKNLSICSFFPKCEETCDGCYARKEKRLSICSFSPTCEKTCGGCNTNREKKLDRCSFSPKCEKTCDGCDSGKETKLSRCSLSPKCDKTCNGCSFRKEKKLSTCSLSSKCETTCDGCNSRKEKKLSTCRLSSKCETTCDGCYSRKENELSNCSLSSKCETTCDGCNSHNKEKLGICNLSSDCKETCNGCRPPLEPCNVHRACPECPGCHQVCSELIVCPNCKECNVEVLPDIQPEKRS